MKRASLLVVALLAAVLAPRVGDAAVPSGFVTRSGSALMVDGKPWRAIGVNLWDMDVGRALRGDVTGCGYQHANIDDYLDRSFRAIAGSMHATVVRTFGFRASYTNGGRDWSATDKLVYYAQKHGIRLIPVFGDQYATCGAKVKDRAWYRSGYRAAERPWGISYRSYAAAVARRYASSPTIAMWQLMNEADLSVDPKAVAAFSADMRRAIRSVDPYHLINLGTATADRPFFDRTLSCASGAGCNDLGEAHVFDPTSSTPGAPLLSSVGAALVFWNAHGNRVTLGHRNPQIEGWTPMTASPQSPDEPYTRWGIQFSAPASGTWAVYVDNVVVTTSTGLQTFTFESGTQGFSSKQAAVSRSTKHASEGSASLRAYSAASSKTRTGLVVAPVLSGVPQSVSFDARVSFRAPGPATGRGAAAMMHASVVGARKPFVFGEIGYRAAVPGIDRCTGLRSTTDRANLLSSFMAAQLDGERGAAGVIVWDWKDPSIRSTTANGTLVNDPTVDCWTITPGDPAAAVVDRFARVVARAPLPRPAALPRYPVAMAVLQPPGPEIVRGAQTPVAVRVTRGGNAVRGVVVRSSACSGSAKTDALGIARFACVAKSLGSMSVRVTCDCGPAQRFSVTSRRAVVSSVAGSIVRTGGRAPVVVTLSELNGSLAGVSWKIPECGARGTIGSRVSRVTFTTSCSTRGWDGTRPLTLRIVGSATTIAREQRFTSGALSTVYYDRTSGECIALSPSTGWVAATARPGACANGVFSYRNGFVFRVPPAERARAFTWNGSTLIVAARSGPMWRVEGRFDGASFSAVITRGGVPVAISG